MKSNSIKALAAILVAAALAIGCAPSVPVLNGSIGGSQTAETAALAAGSTTLKSNNLELWATDSNLSALGLASASFTPVNAAGQIFWIDFSYPVDPATLATSIFIYPLTSAVDLYTNCARGTALPFTTNVVGNRVYFTVDCSTATATVEVYINGETFTGENGTKKMDTNGNGIYGEAGDSSEFTVTVGTAPGATAPAGVASVLIPRPQRTTSCTLTNLLAANAVLDVSTYNSNAANTFTFTAYDTGSSAAATNITIATGAVNVYKNVAGAWTLVGSTTTYDTVTGIATIALTTAPVKGESYKITVDRYYIVETSAVRGYIHRGSYEPDHATSPAVTRYFTFVKTGGAQQSFNRNAVDTDEFACYIDLTVNGTTPIDLSTVTASSLKVILYAGTPLATGTAPNDFSAAYTVTTLVTTTYTTPATANAVTTFRLYLPATVKNLTAGGKILVSPSVLSIASTVAAQDTLSFGNIAGTDGWRVITF